MIPSRRPSIMYPSFMRTFSTVAGVVPSSSAVVPAPQSQCRPSVLSYIFTTSCPAAHTICLESNIMLVIGLSWAKASNMLPVRRSQICAYHVSKGKRRWGWLGILP